MKALRQIEAFLDRPAELIVRHFENRLFELACACIFSGAAILLLFSPGSVEAGGFRYLTMLFDRASLILIFFMLGVCRIVALALNGHWKPHGAYVRAAGAAIGCVMWLQIDAALVTFATYGNALPFSTVTYAVLAVFEAVSMFRALAGAKRDGRQGGLAGTDMGVGSGSHRRASSDPAGDAAGTGRSVPPPLPAMARGA